MRPVLFLFLFCLSAISFAAVPDEFAAIAGRYSGQAFNGDDMDPVVTVLAFDDNGYFDGTYVVEDETGSFEGRLSNLIQEGPYSFSMEWTDHDGEGFLFFEFSRDWSSFNGFWTDQDGETKRPWNGRRQ